MVISTASLISLKAWLYNFVIHVFRFRLILYHRFIQKALPNSSPKVYWGGDFCSTISTCWSMSNITPSGSCRRKETRRISNCYWSTPPSAFAASIPPYLQTPPFTQSVARYAAHKISFRQCCIMIPAPVPAPQDPVSVISSGDFVQLKADPHLPLPLIGSSNAVTFSVLICGGKEGTDVLPSTLLTFQNTAGYSISQSVLIQIVHSIMSFKFRLLSSTNIDIVGSFHINGGSFPLTTWLFYNTERFIFLPAGQSLSLWTLSLVRLILANVFPHTPARVLNTWSAESFLPNIPFSNP